MRAAYAILFFVIVSLTPSCATCPRSVGARDSAGLTALHVAAGAGDLDKVRELLRAGADVNALDSKMGVSVLHKGVYSGNPEVVKTLLEHGALVNLVSFSNGDTPLHDAIYFKKKKSGAEIIRLLLRSGASLSIRNRAGLLPIESARLLGDKESESFIRAEESRRSSEKGRALIKAVRGHDLSLVRKCLGDPATPVEETDEQGFTPLLWASREGMNDIVTLLLEKGANPNHLDQWMGANSGHKAAFWGRTETMRLLVNAHLDLNARGGYNGYTPLHDAVSGSHWETAQVLVQAGARTDIRGHDGKTPVDIARENGDVRMLSILSESQRP